MQPMKTAERAALLKDKPNVQSSDIAEYERLLSQRFTRDPDFPTPNQNPSSNDIEERIAYLQRKLKSAPQPVTVPE